MQPHTRIEENSRRGASTVRDDKRERYLQKQVMLM